MNVKASTCFILQDKTLYNCRRSDLPSNFDTTSDMVPLLTYEEFSHHSKKNNVIFTLYSIEVFAVFRMK